MNIIFLIILFPLISFIVLSFTQGIISEKNASNIAISSVFVSFVLTCFYGLVLFNDPSHCIVQKLWNWMSLNTLQIDFSLMMDELSLSMLFIITGVGLLIHIFSSWYMNGKEGYSRFFAYTNLFIASMSLLVLSDNLVFMYLGWEGVSVCSYLLINFYYQNNNNNFYALKAFIITRISDIFLIISMFLIYHVYGTFNFQKIHFLSIFLKINNSIELNILALFLFIGVLGKSAQFPFHTWLSDAMVGPTPVSALIHAATMVTAGIYLIARTHFLFLLTPDILYIIRIISIITIFLSSVSALVQKDIKRILAYSTMSQIGYMFLALGCKMWISAMIHLMMHAFFKALLFLSSGSLILSSKNEKDIFKITNKSSQSSLLYYSFLIGSLSLISFPLITSGFYSKGNILFNVFQNGYTNLFLIGLFCSFLTSLYTFRMFFVIFKKNNYFNVNSILNILNSKKLKHNIPLLILMILSSFFGIYIVPSLLHVLPSLQHSKKGKIIFEITSSVISLFGIWFSYYIWVIQPSWVNKLYQLRYIKLIYICILNGWYIDWFYKVSFMNFYFYISKFLFYDPFNFICKNIIHFTQKFNVILLKTANENITWYICSILLGISLIFTLVLFV